MHNNRKSAYDRVVAKISSAINDNRVMPYGGMPRLFFLCGANGADGKISYRRKEIKNFLVKHIKESSVIIAEEFFNEYSKNIKSSNALDFEHVLTEISERIIIVMESPSAICELGAFSHTKLRHKLIVINDSGFRDVQSFINTGPIQAISDVSDESRVIWYKMSADIDGGVDSIAEIFPKLYSLINVPSLNNKKITSDKLDPSLEITELKVFFIHDLIFLLKEVKYKDLVSLVKEIFGQKKKYDNVRKILTILISMKVISYDQSFTNIRSLNEKAYFEYTDDDHMAKQGFYLSYLKKKMRA